MKFLALIMALLLLAGSVLASSHNDPGHDSLYIEQVGNSSLTGELNVSDELRVTGSTEVSGLILYGDGTIPGTDISFITAAAGGTGALYLGTTDTLYLKYKGGDQVFVGAPGGTATDLNVSGVLYEDNVRVCLADGTNCLSGNNSGNVSSVTVGDLGLSASPTTGNIVISTNATTCGAGEYSYWTGSAWLCSTPASGTDDQTLQEVTDQGATTTADVIVGSLNATTGHINATVDICVTGGNCLSSVSGGSGLNSDSSGWLNSTTTVTLHDTTDNVSAGALFIDNTNNRIGINTTSPTEMLHINSYSQWPEILITENQHTAAAQIHFNTTTTTWGIGADSSPDVFYIQDLTNLPVLPFVILPSSGNIGLGTIAPTERLHLNGTGDIGIRLEADSDDAGGEEDNPYIEFYQDGGGQNAFIALEGSAGQRSTGTVANAFVVGSEDSSVALQFATSDTVRATFETGGDFGIGTTNPHTQFHVVDTDLHAVFQGTSTSKINMTSLQDSTFILDADSDNSGENDNPRIELGQDGAIVRSFISMEGNNGTTSTGAIQNSLLLGSTNTITYVQFITNNNTRMTIDPSGNIGIGTNDPNTSLHVAGDINVTSGNDVCITGGNCLSTASSGAGNVSGTGTTVDNTITRWSGTGGDTIQESDIIIDDNGVFADSDSNFVIADTVDLGSATTGVRIATTGSMLDIDGNLILNDQVDIGSASTGLRVSTAGGISDIDGTVVSVSDGLTATGNLAGDNFYSDTGSTYLTYVGDQAGDSNSGNRVTAIGFNAGASNTQDRLTAVGHNAAALNTGYLVTAVGYDTAYANTQNTTVAMGYRAGYYNNGTYLTALGYQAGRINIGNYSTLIGFTSGFNNSGNYVTSIGHSAVVDNSVDYVTAVGYEAGRFNTGSHVTTVGHQAGYNNQGFANVFFGYSAGYNNQGQANAFFGYEAGLNATDEHNTFIGYRSGYNSTGEKISAIGINTARSTRGSNISALGFSAGLLSLANNSIYIGHSAGQADTINNQLIIHHSVVDPDSDALIQGDFANENITFDADINVTTGKDICITGGNCLSTGGTDDQTLQEVTDQGASSSNAIIISSTNNPGLTVGGGGTGYISIGAASTISDAAGNLLLDSDTAQTEIAEDLQVTGNNIRDSSATARITLGTTNTITGNLAVTNNITTTNINVSGPGNIYYEGNLTGYGADLAENVHADDTLEPGDVVIISENIDEGVTKTNIPYDTRVAGIISTNPSHLMSADNGDIPLALAGRVPAKASNENGVIKRGDLLTTSSTPGHVMRCPAKELCVGSIVGKAMSENRSGTIIVLILPG